MYEQSFVEVYYSSANKMAKTYYDSFYFFNNTATTEIYTLCLHDALPISQGLKSGAIFGVHGLLKESFIAGGEDRKSTRLNSSHVKISYAVFCLKKKK